MSGNHGGSNQEPAVTIRGRRENGAVAHAPIPATRINWFRFWMRMLIAMLAFNVIAGVITWFFIFPHLHPAG
jgi:hypothetical protein